MAATPPRRHAATSRHVSSQVVLQIVLVNVVVAVLLDKFVEPKPQEGDDSAWDGVAKEDEAPDTTKARRASEMRAEGLNINTLSATISTVHSEVRAVAERLESVEAMRNDLQQLSGLLRNAANGRASAAPAAAPALDGWTAEEIGSLRKLVQESLVHA
jgi:hypothetical protein